MRIYHVVRDTKQVQQMIECAAYLGQIRVSLLISYAVFANASISAWHDYAGGIQLSLFADSGAYSFQ